MRFLSDRLEAWGVGLGVALALWVVLVATIAGGRPWPLTALTLGTVGTVVGVRRLARARPVVVRVGIAVAPIVAVALSGSRGLGIDPLGYTNASAALFVVAAAGAVLVARSAPGVVLPRFGYLLAAGWLLVPWLLRGLTAAIFGLLLPAAVVVVVRRRAVRAMLVTMFVLVLAGLAVAVGLGSGYAEGGRTGAVDRVVDATVGELRVVLWHEATDLVRSAPLVGVGPGRFAEVSPTSQAREDARWAHNEYLQTAAEVGMPGALLLLALAGWLFALLWRAADTRVVPAAVALAAVAVNINIDYLLHFPAVPLGLAVLVGAAAPTSHPALPDPEHERIPGVVLATPGVVLATLALWVLLLAPFEPLNPPDDVANEAQRLPSPPGIRFNGVGGVRSAEPPLDLYGRVAASQKLSIEMVVASREPDQAGPARVVSASDGITNRNLTVGQDRDRLVFRLRTTETDWNATDPQLEVAGVFDTTAVQHLVITTDGADTRVYVDGVLRWAGPGPGGRFDNWNHTYPLLLGNESGGDRGWRGDLHRVAIHDEVLSAATVARHHVEASTRASGPAGAAVALYTFAEAGGHVVHDRSPAGAGGPLLIPSRFPGPRQGLVGELRDTDGGGVGRVAGHALLFALWAATLVGVVPRSAPRRLRVAVAAGGPSVMLAASVVRYAVGRAPSAADVVAAAVGSVIGMWLARAWRRRSGSRPADGRE